MVLPGALAVCVAVVVYLPSLSNGFAWDDVGDIQENEAHHTLAPARALVTPYRTDVPAVRSPYRPLTSMSFALNWQAGEGDPGPFHLMNVLLHGIATALVAALLTALAFPAWAGGVGALIFAVHPVHTEAVANIVGRAEVLMAIFVLAGAVVHLRRSWPRWLRFVLVLGAYAGAVLAKENGIALPALLLALDVWGPHPALERDPPRAGAGARALAALREGWPLYAGLAALAAGYLVLRWSVIGTLAQLDTAAYIVALSPGERFTTAIANLAEVVRLLLWPADLAADYGPAVILPSGPGDPRFWLGLLVGVVAPILALATGRRAPWLALGVAWTVLSFLVVSNLVFPIGIWLAERTLYLPSVGVSILMAGGLATLAASAGQKPEPERTSWPKGDALRRAAPAAAIIAVLVLAGARRTWVRNADWADSDAVVARLAEDHPESYRAHWWLAGRLLDAGDVDAGLRWYRSAVELNPNEAHVALDLVRALILAGAYEEAEERARAIPAGLHPSRSVYLAQSLIEQGRTSEAAAAVREGLERFPTDARLVGQAERLGIRRP